MHISVLDRNSGISLFRNLEKEKYLNTVLRVWTNINKAKTFFQWANHHTNEKRTAAKFWETLQNCACHWTEMQESDQ